ncbi:hypothetical protein C8034_v005400 [Colletotrichum sidae]|uniref:Uncharacterized protein n=1 Tax=Colletotrichum sidae TaxID=1347389 RepID=A0A4R8T6I4_9PEZI|nr:hypothetical protein C8034_v005400 [Colletotrichum sidae]
MEVMLHYVISVNVPFLLLSERRTDSVKSQARVGAPPGGGYGASGVTHADGEGNANTMFRADLCLLGKVDRRSL